VHEIARPDREDEIARRIGSRPPALRANGAVTLVAVAGDAVRDTGPGREPGQSGYDDKVVGGAAFWVIDRTASRSRFLIGYGYLVILPVLFLIWATTQGVAAPASWWGSMWPFLILAAVFFILEVVTLVSSAGERQVLPALKDAVFVVIYLVLLIVAMKANA